MSEPVISEVDPDELRTDDGNDDVEEDGQQDDGREEENLGKVPIAWNKSSCIFDLLVALS